MNATPTSAIYLSNVTISGAGSAAPAIVFLHGLGSDQTSWHRVAPAFESHYQVVLLDLVGAGKSDTAAYEYTKYASLNAHADDLLAVLRELDLQNVVFVGHSVGAMIGVLAAIKEPKRFGRLVLLAPSPRFVNEAGYVGGFEQKDIQELLAAMETNYYGWSQAMAPVMTDANSPEIVMELTNSFFHTQPAIAQHFARVTFYSDHRADLPFLTTPALILQCAHDVIAPVAVGTYLHENLADSQLVVIDTPGHSAHLTAPVEVLHEIEQFLQLAPVFA
ncbi:MAG: alpha/beta fold hydrolase [Janthinobacterium lividum]